MCSLQSVYCFVFVMGLQIVYCCVSGAALAAEVAATRELIDLFGKAVGAAGLAAGLVTGQLSSTLARSAADFDVFPDKSKQVQRNFTLAEVRQCTGQDGGCLYVVYNGLVLDLTQFAPFHMGGISMLQKYGGQDATSAMLAAGMPAQVFDVFLKKFVVGRLVSAECLSISVVIFIQDTLSVTSHYADLWLDLLTYGPLDSIMGEVKRYTFAEVASRDGRNGQPLWVVYKDSVYDITKYIDEHPGGHDTILEDAGKDCTRNFDDVGHTSDAKQILAKNKIGEIVEEEKRYDANGKKKKKVVAVKPDDKPTSRSCLGVITCGLLG